MYFPRPQEEFSQGVFDYIDEKIEEWKAKQEGAGTDTEEYRWCSQFLKILEEMRDYFWKYPDWETIV